MLNLLAVLYGKVRAAWPVNRVVTFLTPILFAPAAGYVAMWVPQHASALGLPPIHLTSAEVLGLFVAGGTRALIAAYKWLDGWQKNEARVALGSPQKGAPTPVQLRTSGTVTVTNDPASPTIAVIPATNAAPAPAAASPSEPPPPASTTPAQ